MGKKLAKPTDGDVFAVPLPDGTHALGQVLRVVEELGAMGCALYSHKLEPAAPLPALGDPISLLLCTQDLLQRHYWPVLANLPVKVPVSSWPWEAHRGKGWVGSRIIGSGIVQEFMAAYHGLQPWDSMATPDYFDKLLVTSVTRPASAHVSRG